MRFATRRVAGWKDRYVNMLQVAERLYVRQRRGYTLQPDEVIFLWDLDCLKNKYNPPKKVDSVPLSTPQIDALIDSINSPEDLYKALYD